MREYELVEHLATIKKWDAKTLELNIVKWGDSEEKYDLRRWEGDIPGRGITLTGEDLKKLLYAINDALDLYILPELDDDDSEDNPEVICPLESYGEIIHSSTVTNVNGQCHIKGHDIQESVIAVMDILHEDMTVEKVELPTTFCLKCNTYYISEKDYLKIIKRGKPLCPPMPEKEYEAYKEGLSDFSNLNSVGKLKSVGYTVDSKHGYTDTFRQNVLLSAIEDGVVTKEEAIEYLTFFIRMRENDPYCREAVAKWRRDRNFLEKNR